MRDRVPASYLMDPAPPGNPGLKRAHERPYPTFAHYTIQNYCVLVSAVIKLRLRLWLGNCEVALSRTTGYSKAIVRAA
jgi:hypothetical protein